MTNHYLKAIHETDRIEQLDAFRLALEDEMRRVEDQLADLEDADGKLPDDPEVKGRWSYEKGRLDSLSTVYGMVVQALLTSGATLEGEKHGE